MSRPRTTDIDRHVGARIRERRIALGLTQQDLAGRLGVTYQQAHKYEMGINRLSAGRLYHVSQALGVELSYFFVGVDKPIIVRHADRDLLEINMKLKSLTSEQKRAVVSVAEAFMPSQTNA